MRTPKGQTMFNGRAAKVTVEVKMDGEVVRTFSVDADMANKLTIEVFPQPKRSPLHPEALNLDDLKVGMSIERHNIYYDGSTRAVGLVTGKPFKRGSKFGYDDTQPHVWMVPVVTINYAGKLVQKDWFLRDMGVVPYEDGHWNEQNYTLAVP